MIDYVDWHIPYRVIKARLVDEIPVPELDVVTEAIAAKLQEGLEKSPGQPIHFLCDLLEVTSFPPLYKMLHRTMPVTRFRNRGVMILVTNSRRLRSIFEITAHVFRKGDFKIWVVQSYHEALQTLDDILAREQGIDKV
jgi:hypothetical protein